MADMLVAVVGVPFEVENLFGTEFAKLARHERVELTILSACGLNVPYTEKYAKGVYDRLAYKLKGRRNQTRESLLAETKLVILFLHKLDGSNDVLFDWFGLEAFVSPLMFPEIIEMPLETRNQRGHLVRQLIGRVRRAIRHARKMLDAIHEEVNGRENKTCLLLPPKTFGKEFQNVQRRVRTAAFNGEDTTSFVKSLKTLRISKHGKYYEGEGKLIFMSPSKAGPRHGLPPVWEGGHESSCVIRGRLRFGTTYDPRFHYDCPIGQGSRRQFPGCHSPCVMPPRRTHANVAPNDWVR